MFEHEHPLNLIDLWFEQYKEESEEDKEESGDDDLTAKQDFRCLCLRCEEEINWFHRVCLIEFKYQRLWIYKCEKCRYYTHLSCATSRNEPFMMSILMSPGTGKTVKNYKDVEHPNLVHLPFPDPSYTILKHLFFKENGSNGKQINKFLSVLRAGLCANGEARKRKEVHDEIEANNIT
ncbi:hypothetical protein QVD17_25517 [Tagetes erecta]|uniref:Zinc finger PHD-type domain-containing protein n=1 Tax=Tagetes erecta TaxID=13708 RepID=A0AAD8NVH9_TARER|nr:hypothetical protein QVD17_25517 [Tagetes erecta]